MTKVLVAGGKLKGVYIVDDKWTAYYLLSIIPIYACSSDKKP